MALELAHSGYNVGGGVPEGGWTLDSFAPAAGMTVARRGIVSRDLGAIEIDWAPTTSAFELECNLGALVEAGNQVFMGRVTTGYMNLRYAVGGVLDIRNGSTTLVTLSSGSFPVPGPFNLRVRVSDTTVDVWIDGVSVASETVASQSWNTSVIRGGVGTAPGGGQANMVIWDAYFRDLASDANTVYLPLDAPNATGGYDNAHPGSTVADATVTGTVLPVRISATTPGSGVPIPEGPVVVSVKQASPVTFTANSALGFSSADADPYGWWNGSALVQPPLSGVGRLSFTGRARATVLAGSSVLLNVRMVDSGTAALTNGTLTLDTANEWKSVSASIAHVFSGSEDIAIEVIGVSAGDTIEVDDVTLTLTLYPDLS